MFVSQIISIGMRFEYDVLVMLCKSVNVYLTPMADPFSESCLFICY